MVVDPESGSRRAWLAEIPPALVRRWSSADQYIAQVEQAAVVMLLIGHPCVLAGRDAFWYIDNTVALSAVVKGSSADPDMARAAAAIHLAMAMAGTRVWFEYIESESNWADEPSRKLWDSSLLRELDFHTFPGSIPAWPWVEEDERVGLLRAAFLSAVGSGSSAVGDPLPTSPFGITTHC
jgi:hypothetical protein